MITLERITQPEHPLYARAMELYKISFPDHEQREPASQARILQDEDYHFTLVRDEGRFLGIALYWEMPEARYLEHFCILPEARNGGCGRQAAIPPAADRQALDFRDRPAGGGNFPPAKRVL